MNEPRAKKVLAGVIGGAGYAGGELVRLLLDHPSVELAFVQSRSQAGKPLSSVHRDLFGVTSLSFIGELDWSEHSGLEVLFLALSHGEAKKLLAETAIPERVRVIDLSHDFRHDAHSKVRTPSGERQFVYGLPELQREKIASARNIANPGCFATAIELALLPLARAGVLTSAAVTGITGSTGAGQALSDSTHFSFRNNNIQAYKTLAHQHLTEILESLVKAAGSGSGASSAASAGAASVSAPRVHFVPWRGDFTRGIFVTAILDLEANPALQSSAYSEARLQELYAQFYRGHPFVSVADHAIDLKSVVNTNRAQIEIVREGQGSTGAIAIHVIIDNLLKGAAGQAVQNMNLMLGLAEDSGLRLKGSVF